MLAKKIMLVESDFRRLIIENGYFVDKSLFVKDVVEGSKVMLFARPRLFGKTLNLTMLKYFYTIEGENAELFANLNIASAVGIMERQGKHPVIYLTFKVLHNDNFESCYQGIVRIITELFNEFRYLLESEAIDEVDKAFLQRILTGVGEEIDYGESLKILARLLCEYHKEKAVILIDDYDKPIQEGYEHGYYEEILGFMRGFLSGVVEAVDYLEKAVIMGMVSVARKSLFSDLTNIRFCTITEDDAVDKFGFTNDELKELLEYHKPSFTFADMKYWYRYYLIGLEIFNPFSVLSCIASKDISEHSLKASSNNLLNDLFKKLNTHFQEELEILALNGGINKKVEDDIDFSALDNDKDAIWNYLVHTGYLGCDAIYTDYDGTARAEISIPNHERYSLFKEYAIKEWEYFNDSKRLLFDLIDRLRRGDVRLARSSFKLFAQETMLYCDIYDTAPEKLYHTLVLGILLCLRDTNFVFTYREPEKGRNDVMLIPFGSSQDSIAILIDFKLLSTAEDKAFEEVVRNAKREKEKMKYQPELLICGCKELYRIVFAYGGGIKLYVEVVSGFDMQDKRISLWEDDFKSLIDQNNYYIDKSLLIKDVVEGSQVLVFTRPIRFGKSLNLTMLKYFYDLKGAHAGLFSNLKISQEKEIMEKQGKHPVIYMNFRPVYQDEYGSLYKRIPKFIANIFSEFQYLQDSETIEEVDKAFLQRMLEETGNEIDYGESLRILTRLLYQHHKVKPVILVDEYDTPIQDGFERGYYEDILCFMRGFLSDALKDGEYLEKAVLVGIVSVSRESLFSGLDNIKFCTVTEPYAADKFGFTEDEVKELLAFFKYPFSLTDRYCFSDDEVKELVEYQKEHINLTEIQGRYYGYNFGGVGIYNPISILGCLATNDTSPHWLDGSSNFLIRKFGERIDASAHPELEILALRGAIHKVLTDNIDFRDISKDNNTLWSYLLQTGYLRYDNAYVDEDGVTRADLCIPNFEAFYLFRQFKVEKVNSELGILRESYANLPKEIARGEIELFRKEFQLFYQESLFFYGFEEIVIEKLIKFEENVDDELEKVYHQLVLGLLINLKKIYYVYSNRDSDLGRDDVMLIPCDPSQAKVGLIFEFKKLNQANNETLEEMIEQAKNPKEKTKFLPELKARNCKEVIRIVVSYGGGSNFLVEVVSGG